MSYFLNDSPKIRQIEIGHFDADFRIDPFYVFRGVRFRSGYFWKWHLFILTCCRSDWFRSDIFYKMNNFRSDRFQNYLIYKVNHFTERPTPILRSDLSQNDQFYQVRNLNMTFLRNGLFCEVIDFEVAHLSKWPIFGMSHFRKSLFCEEINL